MVRNRISLTVSSLYFSFIQYTPPLMNPLIAHRLSVPLRDAIHKVYLHPSFTTRPTSPILFGPRFAFWLQQQPLVVSTETQVDVIETRDESQNYGRRGNIVADEDSADLSFRPSVNCNQCVPFVDKVRNNGGDSAVHDCRFQQRFFCCLTSLEKGVPRSRVSFTLPTCSVP